MTLCTASGHLRYRRQRCGWFVSSCVYFGGCEFILASFLFQCVQIQIYTVFFFSDEQKKKSLVTHCLVCSVYYALLCCTMSSCTPLISSDDDDGNGSSFWKLLLEYANVLDTLADVSAAADRDVLLTSIASDSTLLLLRSAAILVRHSNRRLIIAPFKSFNFAAATTSHPNGLYQSMMGGMRSA